LFVNAQHSSEKGKNDDASQEVMSGGTSGGTNANTFVTGCSKEMKVREFDRVQCEKE